MAANIEKNRTGEEQPALMREAVLRARAERRLIEHELTHRRTLLALTVALPIVGVILTITGDPYIGGAFVGGGLASGAATSSHRPR